MVTLVNRNAAAEDWQRIVSQEEETGEIPLPTIDTIRLDEDRPPVLVLLAPDRVAGNPDVFVKPPTDIPPEDRITLSLLLEALCQGAEAAGVRGRLEAVFHAGGLDYCFYGSEVRQLSEFSEAHQIQLWTILRLIALVGERHIDYAASTIKTH